MPLTVITVKNAPTSLRGDLTKWMQEIATGVYVGNFNTKVREQLWSRVKDSVSNGEATLSFAYRNEIGYCFDTMNAQRKVVDFEGIPLVQLPNSNNNIKEEMNLGFSHAAKFRKIRRYSSHSKNNSPSLVPYVVIDIETDGLDENENSIIEIGAVKIGPSQLEEFNYLVKYANWKQLLPVCFYFTRTSGGDPLFTSTFQFNHSILPARAGVILLRRTYSPA